MAARMGRPKDSPLSRSESGDAAQNRLSSMQLSPLQAVILLYLEGKTVLTPELGRAVGGKDRLREPNSLAELIQWGFVKRHYRLGYYRPDSPPSELGG